MYIWSEFEDIDFYFCPPLGAVCRVGWKKFKVFYVFSNIIIIFEPMYQKDTHGLHFIQNLGKSDHIWPSKVKMNVKIAIFTY